MKKTKTPYPHPFFAKEGWPYIALATAALILTIYFAGWLISIPVWLVFLFVVQFFRDPQRSAPDSREGVLAPADGKIVAVEKTEDPYLRREALKISVFMNVFNAHSNRSPVDGEVKERWYFPGKFFNAAISKASLENERNALWIKATNGCDVVCVQVAGLVARRILCYTETNQKLTRGQRYGFIRFGSRVDVYLPLSARVMASLGDKVYAGETVLALLPDRC